MDEIQECPLCAGPVATVTLNANAEWVYDDGSTVSVPMPIGVASPVQVCVAEGTTWLRSERGGLTRVGSHHMR
jgi:hypothetical protein